MFKLFRETYTSLQDSFYGEKIISRSLKSVVWYWMRYFLMIVAVTFIMEIFFLTNKLPQLPKFIDSDFPEGRVEIQNGILSSTIVQPYIVGNPDFSLILDTSATASALDTYRSGILITQSDLVIKSEDGTQTRQPYTGFPSFSVSKSELSAYISANYFKIWLGLSGAVLLITFLFSSLVWSQKYISYLIWSAVLFLITKYLLKRTLSFINIFKLVIYASVIPLLFSVILALSPNPLLEILNLGILAYFTFNWIWNLGRNSAPPPSGPSVPPSLPPYKSSPPRHHRKPAA